MTNWVGTPRAAGAASEAARLRRASKSDQWS
jgi:hypothetical protein